MELRKQPKSLPLPPPVIPPGVHPIKIELPKKSSPKGIVKPKAAPATSHRPGSKGRSVCLLTNFLKVSIAKAMDDFYHYDVSFILAEFALFRRICFVIAAFLMQISIFCEDSSEIVASKNLNRVVFEKLSEVYKRELAGKTLVYDGSRSLFTLGPLPQNNLELTVVMERKG